jgi:hypothetical protein
MADEKLIREIENNISSVQERKASCIRRQRFEEAYELRTEEVKLFVELEGLTNAEYLKIKWKVIKDKAGHYFSPKHLQ